MYEFGIEVGWYIYTIHYTIPSILHIPFFLCITKPGARCPWTPSSFQILLNNYKIDQVICNIIATPIFSGWKLFLGIHSEHIYRNAWLYMPCIPPSRYK